MARALHAVKDFPDPAPAAEAPVEVAPLDAAPAAGSFSTRIYSIASALEWGDKWQQYAERLQRELADTRRELELQRILADDFGDALARQWAADKFADLISGRDEQR